MPRCLLWLPELLGLPQVNVVTKLEIEGTKGTAHREIEGALEKASFSLPAVISAQKGLNEPRYETLKGIMMAKKKEIPILSFEDLDLKEEDIVPLLEVVKIESPPPRQAGKVIEEEPEEAARKWWNFCTTKPRLSKRRDKMILIFIEVREGKVKKSSLEALSEGKRRADDLNKEANAVLVGHNLESLAHEVLPYGASKVYVVENSILSHYSAAGFSQALFSLVEDIKPEVILFSASSMGKDLAPRLAAKLGVSLASDCTRTIAEDGKLEVVRPIFAGKAFVTLSFKSSPIMATLRPNVFPLGEPGEKKGEVIRKEVVIPEDRIKAQHSRS